MFSVRNTKNRGIGDHSESKTLHVVEQKKEKHCECVSGKTGQRKASRWSRRRRAQPRLMHVHPCCRLRPARLNPNPPSKSEAQCPARRRIRPQERSQWYRQRIARPRHIHVHPYCRLRPEDSGQVLQPKVDRSVHLKSLRVVLLVFGRNVQGEPASKREGELAKRRQAGQQHWRHDGVAEQQQRIVVGIVLIIIGR